MSHTRYESECLVLEAKGQGEANAHYLLFTKEFGLIRGVAQGVKLSQAKLRYALQEFAVLNISLVRGKEFWRVVGADILEHLWQDGGLRGDTLELLARVCKLLKRLVTGEEEHKELYTLISETIRYLKKHEHTPEELMLVELLVVARMLTLLGYFKITDAYRDFLETEAFDAITVGRVTQVKGALLIDINKALAETQL